MYVAIAQTDIMCSAKIVMTTYQATKLYVQQITDIYARRVLKNIMQFVMSAEKYIHRQNYRNLMIAIIAQTAMKRKQILPLNRKENVKCIQCKILKTYAECHKRN